MSEKNFNSTYSRQIGEHMVVAELGRREIVATPFAGNVPDIDILGYFGGQSIPIQVKALTKGAWSFQITDFCEISMDGNRQIIGDPVDRSGSATVFVFVAIGDSAGSDAFYILTWRELRDLVIGLHDEFLSRNNGARPRNPTSMHTGILPNQLEPYRDNWKIIEEQLGRDRN